MTELTGVVKNFDYDNLDREIKRTMRRSAKDVVQIGFMLRRMLEEQLYLSMYADFDSYLHDELHIDYTAATRFIKLNKKYSICGNSMEIATEYEEYSQSLLVEMLTMPPELEEKVTPDMTVSQVREIKKQAKEEKKTEQKPVPEKEEVVIDGEYREIEEKEKVATSQPEEDVSPYGFTKSEYPPDSLIATKGCGNMHECFSCAQSCTIRQEARYCVEAPLGNPFSCTTMNVLENLKDEFGDECQFVNQELAYKRAGDGEAVPCCKKCQVYDCGYRCRRAVNLWLKAETFPEEMEQEDSLSRLKKLLDKKKQELDECMKVNAVEHIPDDYMYEKKTVVRALANMLCELDGIQDSGKEPEESEQQELPVLKNNDQRKEWLTKYKDWGLWYRDERIDVDYYKFDFEDGSRLVVTEYPQRHSYWNDESKDEHYYHLLEKNKKSYKKKPYDEKYRHKEDSETYLVEFLKNLQKKG